MPVSQLDQAVASLDPDRIPGLPSAVQTARTAWSNVPVHVRGELQDDRPGAERDVLDALLAKATKGPVTANDIDVGPLLGATARHAEHTERVRLLRISRRYAVGQLAATVRDHRDEVIEAIRVQHRRLAEQLWQLSATPSGDETTKGKILDLGAELESLRMTVVSVSEQRPSEAIWLAWDRSGWVENVQTRDIWAGRFATRYGTAGRPEWYAEIAKPGRMPLDDLWCPTPQEMDQVAERLIREAQRPPSPEVLHERVGVMHSVAAAERASR